MPPPAVEAVCTKGLKEETCRPKTSTAGGGYATPANAKAERDLRRSPLYDVLKSKRAVFGEKNGWERALWFAPDGMEPKEQMTFGRGNWEDQVAREVAVMQENVAILDQSSFGKIEVRGRDALKLLQRLATRNIDKPIGSLSYTQMCNEKGRIECDLTVARLADEHFYVVTGTALIGHDLDWIKKNIKKGESVVAYDATSTRGVLNLCGPQARQVLEKTTSDDVSNAGFPRGTCREIFIGAAPVLALRVSYHGELGWELHIPTEFTAYVYEQLHAAGKPFVRLVLNAMYSNRITANDVSAYLGIRLKHPCVKLKGVAFWGTI